MSQGSQDVFGAHPDVAPSVIGAAHAESMDAEEEVPQSVYVPSERATRRDAEVTIELRDTTEGYRAMLVFTSLKALVKGCGDGQPWVQIRGHQIDELRERSGAEVILWDAALPEEERRTRFQERG